RAIEEEQGPLRRPGRSESEDGARSAGRDDGHARWFIAARPPASAIASAREGIRDGTLETMMQIPCKGWFVTCGLAALIAAAFVGRPEPARAQFGISIGGFPIGINIHGYRGYRGGRRPPRPPPRPPGGAAA